MYQGLILIKSKVPIQYEADGCTRLYRHIVVKSRKEHREDIRLLFINLLKQFKGDSVVNAYINRVLVELTNGKNLIEFMGIIRVRIEIEFEEPKLILTLN